MEESDNNRNESTETTKKVKQPLVTFAKLNKFFLIPFLTPISSILVTYFYELIDETNVIKNKMFIEVIYEELSYVAVGLLYFVSYFKLKPNKEKEKEKEFGIQQNSSPIKYIYNEENRNYDLKQVSFVVILLSLILETTEIIYYYIDENKNNFTDSLYYLLFIPLLSKYILKEKIYKHQYLSLIIAIFGSVFLIIPVCLVINTDDIVSNIVTFIYVFMFSLFVILIKRLNQKNYISVFKLCLLFGILSIILHCLGFFIYSLIKYHDLSYFKDCFDSSEDKNIFIIILYFIINFIAMIIENLLQLLTVLYFSPNLIIITYFLNPMIEWIIKIVSEGGSIPEDAIYPIGFIIELFSSLIYNEIIILNFCGLSQNTKKYVEQRLMKELQDMRKEDVTITELDNDDLSFISDNET